MLDRLRPTEIDDVVLVIGRPVKEQVVEYAQWALGERFDFDFVEQPSPEGLGHSIYQARPAIDRPALIALDNTIFESGCHEFLAQMSSVEALDGRIGCKPVNNPQYHNVADIEDD
jgi:glucose-1-phosphate thymidylyltransferase